MVKSMQYLSRYSTVRTHCGKYRVLSRQSTVRTNTDKIQNGRQFNQDTYCQERVWSRHNTVRKNTDNIQ